MQALPVEVLKERLDEQRASLREGLQRATAATGAADRELLRWILSCDRAELWREDGCRNVAQWLSSMLGISNWKARRWVGAAYALEHLHRVSAALECGALSLDKTVELARFATSGDETKLVKWARRVSVSSIRERADQETRRQLQEVQDAHGSRYFRSWRADAERIAFEGLVPLEQGAALIESVDRLAHELPKDPEDQASAPGAAEPVGGMEQRRVDALVLLATSGCDGNMAPTIVVLHAPVEALAGNHGNCSLESGEVLHPETARRISCDARLQVVLHGADGNAVGIGGTSQIAPTWLRRQVFRRDGNRCTFPGCEMKRFLSPHHIQHWGQQGPTDLDNLVTVCSSHHRFLHESGWSVALNGSMAEWSRPDGRPYDPGPAPLEHPGDPSGASFYLLAQASGYARMFDLIRLL